MLMGPDCVPGVVPNSGGGDDCVLNFPEIET